MRDRGKTFVILVVVAAALFAGSFSAATQYTAAGLGYQRPLGPAVGVLAGTPVYPPWAWLAWSQRFEAAAPQGFGVAQGINFGGAVTARLDG